MRDSPAPPARLPTPPGVTPHRKPRIAMRAGTAVAALALAAWNAHAACDSPQAERPQVQVNDRWEFRTSLPGSSNPLVLQHQVQAVQDLGGGFTVAVRSNRMAQDAPALLHRFDGDFNRLSREIVPGESIHYAPAFPLFRFPLQAGQQWQLDVQQTQTDEPGASRVQIQARVVGCEEVEVPAGRFQAWRIDAVYLAGQHRIESSYWYAPRAKRSVLGLERTQGPRGDSELRYELLSMQMAR